MTLIEMEGFLRGKCLPGDILPGETNAQYLLRKLNAATELQRQLTACEATVTNLEAQVQGLAAESAKLKKFCKNASFDADYEAELAMERGGFTDALNDIKTPHTDAALAEIRAQGVDMAIEHLTKKFEGTGGVGVPVMALEYLASELRKEQGK